MTITDSHADQIAALLNARNQLTRHYTRELVLEHADEYFFRLSEENYVVACVKLKRVQWYQCEILHLTVAASQTRKGHAKALLCEAERVASAKGARLIQCTIRDGNTDSRSLFEGFNFVHVSTFNNPSSGNNVTVFQKVLSSAHYTCD